MCNNGCQSLIEQTRSRYAQHRFAVAPSFWQRFSFNLRLGLFKLGKGRVLLCRLCTLLVYISVRRKVVDKLSDRIADAAHLIFIERTALRVSLCEPQTLQQDFVVIRREWLLLQKDTGLIGRLNGVARQHALISQFRGSKRRFIAEHHLKKLELIDVATQDHEAHRERSREDQTDRSPQPCPESSSGDHSYRR